MIYKIDVKMPNHDYNAHQATKARRTRAGIYVAAGLLALAAAIALLLGNGGGRAPSEAQAQRNLHSAPAPLSTPSAVGTSSSASEQRGHPRARSLPDAPVNTAGAAPAVRGFLIAWLAWSTGRAPVGALVDATSAFLAQAREHPPNVPPAQQGVRARITSIEIVGAHPALAYAHISLPARAGLPFVLALRLVHSAHGWLVGAILPTG